MKIYLCAIIGAFILCAYLAGLHLGREKCRTTTAQNTTQIQIQTIKQMETVNEQTMHTTVHDIRRILRTKYTIAE